jgi:alkylation response protein AidB-like acyl-CoA dehydrogenase
MDAVLEVARAVADKVRGRSAEIEQARRLPADVVAALVDADLFRMCVPADLGGTEVHPVTLSRVLEEVAAADAATGWCLMIAATSGVNAAVVEEPWATRIFGEPSAVTGGVFAPRGEAAPADGGFRVSGRWPFASGCEHSTWLAGGAFLPGAADGPPVMRLFLFPATDVEIIDTWHVAGLAGTGSHDIAVHDVFVPSELAVMLGDPPKRGGALFRVPVFGLLATGVASVALGIARAAVDSLLDLAGAKTPTMSRRTLAENRLVQVDVARCSAALGAARASLHRGAADAWDAAGDGEVPLALRAQLRMAACHATETAASVVDAMYGAGGGTSVYADSPLQRHLRDVHVVTQHVMVGRGIYETAGRVLLGLPADTAFF